MKKATLTVLVAAVAAVASVPTATAQANKEYRESVVVKGSYRPVLEQSEKLNFPAVVTDTFVNTSRSFDYSIKPQRMKALYEPSRIKAARIVGEPATKLYNNYLRLGFGNYWSPLADLYWCSTRDKRKTYGVRVNHASSWGSLDGYGKNHYGNTMATLFGKYIVGDALQLSSDVSYEHDHNLYYGFHDSDLVREYPTYTRDSLKTADYRASYNVATWNLGVRNMQLDPNKLGYAANLKVADMWALWGQNEFGLTLAGDIHYGFNIQNQYKGVAYLRMAWDGFVNSVRSGDKMPMGYRGMAVADTVKGFRNLVTVNPYADFMFSGLQFHVGLSAGIDGYTTDSAVAVRLFPDVVVSKELMGGALSLSLGATGGMEANTWNRIRMVNPYVSPGADLRTTSHYDFTGHARWSISKKLEARAELGYSLLRDDLNFTLDTMYRLRNVYRPDYVDNNRFVAGLQVAFVNDEMLTLRAGGHYYAYTAAGDDTAVIYRPDWDVEVGAVANYHDKWLVHLDVQLMGSMQADEGERVPMRYGVGAEVEYRHNKALSFFLRMDNLAFQRYYYWSHYPSQRGLFLLGATYTLPNK